MEDAHVVDPFDRDGVVDWLRVNNFKDYEGHGYWQKAYSLSHGYITLSVGIPEGQICANVIIERGNVDERQRIHVGSAYTAHPIAALWAVLNLFDFDASRDAMFWRDYHERRYPMKPRAEDGHRSAETV